jgi:SPP1 gp7 family putative phage head morphogenesis protein
MSNDEPLSKAELALIDKIIVAAGLAKFRNTLWGKVRQAFGFSFHGTNIEYGFARATPDERALKYLEDRIFILSDKTQVKLVGDLRWEMLEGMRNAESIDQIKRRLDGIFEGNTVNTERIARTEVLNAQNAGRYQAHVESGIAKYKQWQAAINNRRTAADSKRLHGQLQEIENPFIDPLNGDSFMHPPNRPNCRCTTLYLRKLPPNIVRKGGQMYNADVMIGKIEIDIGSLQKVEDRIWIKPTEKRKGHWRKVRPKNDS